MTKIEVNFQFNNKNETITIINKNKKEISKDFIISNICEQIISDENYRENWGINSDNFSKDDLNYEYIKYKEKKYNAWVLFKDNQILKYDENEIIKILIKGTLITNEHKKLKQELKLLIDKVQDISDKIRNKNIYKKNNNKIIDRDLEIDIVVLTANPLLSKKNKNNMNDKELELQSINDFHNVTSSIYNTISNSTKCINAVFMPLTINNLKKAISHRPQILHLICKSTYIIPDSMKAQEQKKKNKKIKINKDFKSYNYVNLIFEDNNYFYMEMISKKNLDDIFGEEKEEEEEEDKKIEKEKEEKEIENEIKENEKIINNIILIISTQLSKDVYEMVKNYGFKYVLVQHTTIADSNFVANFNEQFYKSILEQKESIKACFNYAKNIKINYELNQFCCCYHDHLEKCDFMKNFENELYISDNNEDDNSKKFTHFSHLRYKCECSKKNNNFAQHSIDCKDNNEERKELKKNNTCCCREIKENNHNSSKIEEIFFNNFQEKCEIINFGDGNDGVGMIENYDTNYDKMKLVVGRNKIIYDIYNKIIKSNNDLLNVYQYEFNELPDIIIEYFIERINLLNEEENLVNINKKKSFDDIPKNIPTIGSDSSLKIIENAPLHKIKKYNFEKIELKKDELYKLYNLKKKDTINIIYFIIILEDNIIKDIFKKININDYKIIFFTKKEINVNNLNIEKIKLEGLKEENYNIKYQIEKIKYKKEEFNDIINQKKKENKDTKTYIYIESNIKCEILYLFNILEKFYEWELQILYPDNNGTVIKLLRQEQKSIKKETEDKLKKIIEQIDDVFSDIIKEEIKNEYNKYKESIIKEFNKIQKKIEKAFEFKNNMKKKDIYNKLNDIEEKLIDKELLENIRKGMNILEKKRKESNINFKEKEKKFNNSINNIENELNDYKKLLDEKEGKIGKELEVGFNSIKDIIEKEFWVIIKREKNKEDTKKYIYQKEYLNDHFNIFYNNWKNKISNEIKQKILINLFEYFSISFRKLIKLSKENYKPNNYYIKKFKPVNSLTSFSAIQELGIWKSEYNHKDNINDYKLKSYDKEIDDLKKYCSHLAHNFINIFTLENINLSMNDTNKRDELLKYIKDISITYYTCLKLCEVNNISFKDYSVFIQLFEKYKEEFLFASIRFRLMNFMNRGNINNLDELNKIIEEFKNNKYIEGELEAMFGKLYIYIKEKEKEKENVNKQYYSLLDRIEKIEKDNECKVENKKRFINLFKCKVKYIFIKYKIKNRFYQDGELKELSINYNNKKCMVNIFKEEKNYFYLIKTFLLISEWKLLEYNTNQEDKSYLNNKEYYYYLNFALYLSYIYNYKEYIIHYIESKKKINNKINKESENKNIYNEIVEKLKEFCKKYICEEYKEQNYYFYIN